MSVWCQKAIPAAPLFRDPNSVVTGIPFAQTPTMDNVRGLDDTGVVPKLMFLQNAAPSTADPGDAAPRYLICGNEYA
jgi:hypothetical protein